LMNRLAIANSLKTFEISDSRVKVESWSSLHCISLHVPMTINERRLDIHLWNGPLTAATTDSCTVYTKALLRLVS
jgi:hypothetical protein